MSAKGSSLYLTTSTERLQDNVLKSKAFRGADLCMKGMQAMSAYIDWYRNCSPRFLFSASQLDMEQLQRVFAVPNKNQVHTSSWPATMSHLILQVVIKSI